MGTGPVRMNMIKMGGMGKDIQLSGQSTVRLSWVGCDVRLSEVADANDPQAHIWKGFRTESQSLPLGLSSSSQGPQQMPKAENTIALTLASHPQKDPSCDFLKDTTPCGKSQLIICEASSLRMVPVLGFKDAKKTYQNNRP